MTAPLTPEERGRFAAWLEADATGCEQMADQLEISAILPLAKGVASKLRDDAAAARRVALLLRQTESQEL